MNQATFAEFIEDHIGELAAPHEDEISFWQEKLGGIRVERSGGFVVVPVSVARTSMHAALLGELAHA
ncbi:hypothetical protein D3C87_1963960 [compost metagenome]